MEDFASLDEIKALYSGSEFINLNTVREGGGPSHPSNVRVVHGWSLSMYFLTEASSEKAKGIERDSRVTGSLVIDKPEPGKGVNFYFNGVAQKLSLDEASESFLPNEYREREKLILALCKGRQDYWDDRENILAEKSDVRLHRILLTDAWYNGGVTKEGSAHENNATRTLKIVGDKAVPLLRRYFVPADEPTPDYAMELPYGQMFLGMAASARHIQ